MFTGRGNLSIGPLGNVSTRYACLAAAASLRAKARATPLCLVGLRLNHP
jgi:hypothetical protein